MHQQLFLLMKSMLLEPNGKNRLSSYDKNFTFILFSYESNSGGEREIQRTMLELLNQLDGFDSRGDVKVKLRFDVFFDH